MGQPTDTGKPRSRTFPIGRLLAVAVFLGIVIVWIWAFAAGSSDPAGLLEDRSFGETATSICETTTTEISTLPQSYEITEPSERADVVDRTNSIYTAMLDQLAAASPSDERDATMVQEWIGDWRNYVADRSDYAQRLRSDESARFYVSTKDGNQLTNPIDRFARINGMLACATPSDLS